MKWLNQRRGKGFLTKTPSPKEDRLDATMDSTKQEANVALAIARESVRERGETTKQIKQRILLTEMAARLRVALFTEVRTKIRSMAWGERLSAWMSQVCSSV